MLQRFDERNRDIKININGTLYARDEAGISPFDSAVQGGDAVWEGLRIYEGRVFKLTEHLDRLRGSALALAFEDIPSPDSRGLYAPWRTLPRHSGSLSRRLSAPGGALAPGSGAQSPSRRRAKTGTSPAATPPRVARAGSRGSCAR